MANGRTPSASAPRQEATASEAATGWEDDPPGVRARRRNRLRLRRRGVLLSVLVVAGAYLLFSPDGLGHRLNARTVAVEWGRCLLYGEAPQAQPQAHAAYRLYAATKRGPPAYPRPAEELPVVDPRLHLTRELPPQRFHPAYAPRSIVVAVIDSGVRADHPDLAEAAVLPGADLVNPCGNGRQDVTGHGTMVAGVIASQTHGGAPGVKILPVRVSLATGQNPRWLSAAGIIWATREGADVINLSYSSQGRRPSLLERFAVWYATRNGVALVGAAGNDPGRTAGYPAAYNQVLSVTSVDGHGRLSVFAARTGKIDVAAPGSRVVTLAPDGSFRTASGTSFAAPLASAAVAQLLTTYPDLSGVEAVAALRGATDPNPDWEQVTATFGMLDLSSARANMCEVAPWCHPRPDPEQVQAHYREVQETWERRWVPPDGLTDVPAGGLTEVPTGGLTDVPAGGLTEAPPEGVGEGIAEG